jgi:hypothetical protein
MGEGNIEDCVLQGHLLAQTVAYGNLGPENPAQITAAYEQQANPVIELQLEKAGVTWHTTWTKPFSDRQPTAEESTIR